MTADTVEDFKRKFNAFRNAQFNEHKVYLDAHRIADHLGVLDHENIVDFMAHLDTFNSVGDHKMNNLTELIKEFDEAKAKTKLLWDEILSTDLVQSMDVLSTRIVTLRIMLSMEPDMVAALVEDGVWRNDEMEITLKDDILERRMLNEPKPTSD